MSSHETLLFPLQIGLRDSKQLAKALQRALSKTPPSTPEDARRLVDHLPWPTAMGQDRPLQPVLEPLSSPNGFVRLGVEALPQGEGEAFDWTHASALKGTLAFGPAEKRALLAEHLFLQATLSGTPATLVTVADDARFLDRVRDALESQGQGHRLRVLNFLQGSSSDTFNFLEQGPTSIRFDHLFSMVKSVPAPDIQEPQSSEWSILLIYWLSAMVMYMVTKGDRIGRRPDLAWLLELTSPFQAEQILLEDPAPPTQVRAALLELDRRVQALFPTQGYSVLAAWLKDFLESTQSRFGHVLRTSTDHHPGLRKNQLIGGDISTVVILPRDGKVVAHLMMDVLSLRSSVYAFPWGEPPTNVRHLILLDRVGQYGTAPSLNLFLDPDHSQGVAKVLLEEDYPSLKPMGEHVGKTVSHYQVKMFLNHTPAVTGNTDEHSFVPKNLDRHLNFLEDTQSRVLDCSFLATRHAPIAEGHSQRRDSMLGKMAKVLWEHLQAHPEPTLARCQQAVARMTGRAHWHELEQQSVKQVGGMKAR